MHICFVAPQAWPVLSADPHLGEVGGAEVQQSILARLLAANGYRVSMICLDYGQPERALIDGITVHKTYRPDEGVPVLRFLHPRLTALWRALREVDADVYYTRSAGMLAGVVAEFCRRHGRRSIYAGASDMDFAPDQRRADPLRARPLAVPARRRARRPHRGAERGAALELPRDLRARRGGDSELLPAPRAPRRQPRAHGHRALGRRHPRRQAAASFCSSSRGACRSGASSWWADRRGGDAALFERTRAEAATLPNVEFTGFLPLAEVEPRFDAARLLVNTSDYEGHAEHVPPGLGARRTDARHRRRRHAVHTVASATSRPARAKSKRCSPIRNAGRTPPSAAASTSSATTREARRSRTTAGFSKGSPHERGLGRRLVRAPQAPRALDRRGEGVRPRDAVPAAGRAGALPRHRHLRRVPPAVARGRHDHELRHAQHVRHAVLLRAALRAAGEAPVRAPDADLPGARRGSPAASS